MEFTAKQNVYIRNSHEIEYATPRLTYLELDILEAALGELFDSIHGLRNQWKGDAGHGLVLGVHTNVNSNLVLLDLLHLLFLYIKKKKFSSYLLSGILSIYSMYYIGSMLHITKASSSVIK